MKTLYGRALEAYEEADGLICVKRDAKGGFEVVVIADDDVPEDTVNFLKRMVVASGAHSRDH